MLKDRKNSGPAKSGRFREVVGLGRWSVREVLLYIYEYINIYIYIYIYY